MGQSEKRKGFVTTFCHGLIILLIYWEHFGFEVDANSAPPYYGSYPPPPGGSPARFARSNTNKVATQVLDYAASHPGGEIAKNDFGCPIPSLSASLTVGRLGSVMLDDVFLINELGSFARERIPERVAYAKGFGAYGTFRLLHDISTLTKADFLHQIGKTTRVLVRFSRGSGKLGSPDLIRSDRGFAIKFYTTDGIFDLVGNSYGVYPITDPMLFPDLVHSANANPETNLEDATMRWDFRSLRPESILHTLKFYSDYGANSRVLNGHSVHAFKFVNGGGAHTFVKFHLISEQPFRWFNDTELEIVSGLKPDYAMEDLFNAIGNRNFPRWLVKIQVMTPEQAATYRGNPFDVTKEWRLEDFPLMTIGELILNENPINYFVDIEQAAFSPGNLVPGIEPNPSDKMFHARMFAYQDAQGYRLGSNYALLEPNRPKFAVKNYYRDGFMRSVPNGGSSPTYFPNSFHGPGVNASATWKPFFVQGIVDRLDIGLDDVEETFRQARTYLYQDLSPEKRKRVAHNLGRSLAKAIKRIRDRAITDLFQRVSPEFGREVWEATEDALAAQQ